jgi:hypothetical protein
MKNSATPPPSRGATEVDCLPACVVDSHVCAASTSVFIRTDAEALVLLPPLLPHEQDTYGRRILCPTYTHRQAALVPAPPTAILLLIRPNVHRSTCISAYLCQAVQALLGDGGSGTKAVVVASQCVQCRVGVAAGNNRTRRFQ